MRDGNRIRERFQLQLDGRQVASVVVAGIVVLGGTFVLGLNVGKQVARDAQKAIDASAPADPLAALDSPPVPPDTHAEPPPRLDFHEQLTKSAPPAPPPAPPAPKAVAKAKPAEKKPEVAEKKPPAPALPPSTEPAPAPAPRADEAAPSAWAIQVGAAQDEAEANRIAEKFQGRQARVVAADVPGKGRWYRVRVGSFDSRDAADRYLKDLVRETGARAFVTATRSP